jgi:hypothetical protein
MLRIVIVILIYHDQKPIDGITFLVCSGVVMGFLFGEEEPIELS